MDNPTLIVDNSHLAVALHQNLNTMLTFGSKLIPAPKVPLDLRAVGLHQKVVMH